MGKLDAVPMHLGLRFLTRSDIRDRSQYYETIRRPDGIKTNFDRNFAPIFAPTEKLASRSHRTRLRIEEVPGAIARMVGSEPFRKQQLDGAPYEFVAPITEDSFHLSIYQSDLSLAIRYNH